MIDRMGRTVRMDRMVRTDKKLRTVKMDRMVRMVRTDRTGRTVCILRVPTVSVVVERGGGAEIVPPLPGEGGGRVGVEEGGGRRGPGEGGGGEERYKLAVGPRQTQPSSVDRGGARSRHSRRYPSPSTLPPSLLPVSHRFSSTVGWSGSILPTVDWSRLETTPVVPRLVVAPVEPEL